LRGRVQADAGHARRLAAHPWDKGAPTSSISRAAQARGLFFDSTNSNTVSGSTGPAVVLQIRQPQPHGCGSAAQAIEHNLECLDIGAVLGARAHTVWIGDGGNFPASCTSAARSIATSTA
jgi:L-rhamnose isomerase/sugar isomerase